MADENRYFPGDSDNEILKKILRTFVQIQGTTTLDGPVPGDDNNVLLAKILKFLQGQ